MGHFSSFHPIQGGWNGPFLPLFTPPREARMDHFSSFLTHPGRLEWTISSPFLAQHTTGCIYHCSPPGYTSGYIPLFTTRVYLRVNNCSPPGYTSECITVVYTRVYTSQVCNRVYIPGYTSQVCNRGCICLRVYLSGV